MTTTLRASASFAGLLLLYYFVPLSWTGAVPLSGIAVTVVGAGVLAWAMTAQILSHLRGLEPVGLPSLAFLLPLVVVVFALGYVALETARPGQFVGLVTRTDALYFALQVLSTVGLGDVHAAGQTARVLVSVQMAFDLVFVAAAVAVMAGRMRERFAAPVPTRGTSAPGGER